MIALSLSDINLSFGTDVILDGISFSINDGDRLGIIGVNGAGKTSLFNIISGKRRSDSGAVYVQRGHKIGVLEQNPDLTALPDNICCLEYMYTAFPELLKVENEIEALERDLSHAAILSHEKTMQLSASLAEKSKTFEDMGGFEFRSRCRSTLMRLGFGDDILTRKINTLSGGQYTRLALARLLATEPDILMLDEPTNHLDIDALVWLENYIANYKKTVIIISHDRYFLDKTTNKTLHIQYGKAKLHNGNYTFTKNEEEKEAESLERRYKEQQKEIAKIKANIDFQRRCNREHNFVTIRSKEKQLARMEKVELAPKAPKDIRLTFLEESDSANDVLEVKDVKFGYGNETIIDNLSFLVRRYERVMVLGPNGSGKSTLMKLINSRLVPTRGKITLGYNVKIGYYDQENRGLSENKTVFEELHDVYPETTNLEIRSTLALFLFGAEDIDKPVHTLSGGERARLTLAKLILKKVNLLVMDEPTNHLDIGSADALETALLAFDGTVIAVSHDRYFINRIATRLIELDKTRDCGMLDCAIDAGDDAFDTYLKLREISRQNAAKAEPVSKNVASKTEYEQRKKENALERANKKKTERAKVRAQELEKEIEALDEELFTTAAADYVRACEIEARKSEIEEELLNLYEIIL